MSNRLYQGIVHQMKGAIGRKIGVTDENGTVIACSDLLNIGETRTNVREALNYPNDTCAMDGYTYRFIATQGKEDTIVFVEGEDKYADKMAYILSISLGSVKSLYDEKYDKLSFIKNIILDNILPSDIYMKSHELHFSTDAKRVVFVVRFFDHTETSPHEILQALFPDKTHDFVISVSEQDVVLVREMPDTPTHDELVAIGKTIVGNLSSEFYTKSFIGISNVVDNLKDLANAYKEARMSLEVGKVFDTEKNVISYDNLGIGRLIYQLPTTLCDIFLDEVFKNQSFDELDSETLQTIQCFFDNNLNVSETSRKLYVHRNTLVYRLEKINKLFGLDLRRFDHAITFKVALMVKRYLANRQSKY